MQIWGPDCLLIDILKTAADLRDLNEWNMSRPGQRASGSTTQSGRPPLVNAFLKAVTRGELEKGQWPYRRIADFLTACGWPVSVDTVKQSKKRGKLALGPICFLSPEDLRFAHAVYRENPDCRVDVLVTEGSQAARAAARSADIGCGRSHVRALSRSWVLLVNRAWHSLPTCLVEPNWLKNRLYLANVTMCLARFRTQGCSTLYSESI